MPLDTDAGRSWMTTTLRASLARRAELLAFLATYVAMDWFSYIEPLFGLNITPWNPAPALGLVYWLKYGKAVLPYWFAALFLAELLIRATPEGLPLTALLSAWLLVGYALTGAWLRRYFRAGAIFSNRRGLTTWIAIVAAGTCANALVYLLLLNALALIPHGQWMTGFVTYWVGDLVGIFVSMPCIWLLATKSGRAALRANLGRSETLGYLLLSAAMVWLVFWLPTATDFKRFYLLFVPVVWAAARQGLPGTAFIAVVLQVAVVVVNEWLVENVTSVVEFQLLGAVLAIVGFFIGVVVDEQRKAADDMKQTLRLAVAGDMATALAHELNQPITALSAYGKACEHLMARGEVGEVLRDTIRRMVSESTRAAEVVRRLREFFRSGEVHFESFSCAALLASTTQSSLQLAQERGVELALAPAPAATVLADRMQMGVVMHNLLSNAIEAVAGQPAGSRRIAIAATVRDGGKLRLKIEDSGPGIAAGAAARLFEPFVSSKSSGFGLGLVISRAIVEAHGGNLWAEVGEHGVFILELPLAESNPDEE